MAYDRELAERIARLLADEPDLSEKKMFGGLAFLLGGQMAVAATDEGLLLRIDPDRRDELTADPAAEPFVMRGRPMTGWLGVTVDATTSEEDLARWVGIGVAYVRTLPPK